VWGPRRKASVGLPVGARRHLHHRLELGNQPSRLHAVPADCFVVLQRAEGKATLSFPSPLAPTLSQIVRLMCLQPHASIDEYPMDLPAPRISLQRVAWSIIKCARRMSIFRACAFREQEDDQAALLNFEARLPFSPGGWPVWSPTARNFLTRPPTGRHISPALPSDCFAIDFPGRAISPGEGLPNFPTCPRGSGPGRPLLHCAHRTSTVSPCAFCEQEGQPRPLPPSF